MIRRALSKARGALQEIPPSIAPNVKRSLEGYGLLVGEDEAGMVERAELRRT